MPSYAYLAYTEAGQRREGRIDAEGTSAAEQALWLEGLKIVELNPAPPRKTMADYFPSLYQISRADIILFTRQLATFVGAGVPMSRALGTIAQETASPLFKRVILAVLDDLERGQNLSEALAKHHKVFPALYIDLVRVAVIITIAGAMVLALRTSRGIYAKDQLSIKAPILGPIVLSAVLNRFARTLAMVLKAGVPLGQTFEAVIASTGNRVFQKGLATVKEQMTSGEGFAGPLIRTRLFPPMLTQMVRVGEETGTLDTYLEQAAEFYEEELEYRIRAMTSLIEPVMTVAVGIMVGFIAVSLISAMYGLVGALK